MPKHHAKRPAKRCTSTDSDSDFEEDYFRLPPEQELRELRELRDFSEESEDEIVIPSEMYSLVEKLKRRHLYDSYGNLLKFKGVKSLTVLCLQTILNDQ